MSEKTHIELRRTQISEWIGILKEVLELSDDKNVAIVAFEMNYALYGDLATWMVPAQVYEQSPAFEVRDFFGRVTVHSGKIKAIKHIRDAHGWGLALSKKWCDHYGRDMSTHDEYGRPYLSQVSESTYVPTPSGDRDEDDQPF